MPIEMPIEETRAELRERLGSVGVWTFALDGLAADAEREAVGQIEGMGFPVLWIPEGLSSKEVFAHSALLLAASERLAVATGIANLWARDAVAAANGARTLADAYPGRFVLGIGVGHQYSTEIRGSRYERPLGRMRGYLDAMDEAPSRVPEPGMPAPRLLAALGPRMLQLAAERTAGAHSYFVPVEHTELARETLGPDPVLAVEQTVVLETDPSEARRVARSFAVDYLELPNYANNLRRLGWGEEDVAGEGTDRLIDATIAWGDVDAVGARVRAHLDAGADHVCLQVVSLDEADACLGQLRELASALLGG